MRLYISDVKDNIILFLFDYLESKMTSSDIKIIVNGEEHQGVVKKVELDPEEYKWIKIYINDEELTIPFNNKSKVRLDKGLYFIETETHTSLIYL